MIWRYSSSAGVACACSTDTPGNVLRSNLGSVPTSSASPLRDILGKMASIEVREADITKIEVDAIANAANTDLRHGGGVAGAIVRAGGRSIQAESDRVAPIGLGEAVATGAGELPAKWV